MEQLIVIIVWVGVLYYLYLKFKKNNKKHSFSEPNTINMPKNKHAISNKPIKQNSIEDDVKQLKSTLSKLRKKAEEMERYDEDGLDDVLSDIKHYENIISPYEIQKLVEKVTDLKSYRALEKKYEHTNYGRTVSYEEIERREAVLEEAYTLAGEKTYKYILWVDIDINTPLALLQKAGKAYYYNEAMKTKEACSSCTLITVPFNEMDEIEDYKYDLEESGIKELIKIKTIINNNKLNDFEKEKKINSIISKDEDLKDMYFNDADSDNYYDLYFHKKQENK